MNNSNKKKFAGIRADIIVVALLVLVGAAIALGVFLFSGKGKTAEVRIDGKICARYSLSQDRSIRLSGAGGGTNLLVIKNGEAYIAEADCPDGLCIRTGSISRVGQSVVCLPHRIVVEITGDAGDGNDIDVFVK